MASVKVLAVAGSAVILCLNAAGAADLIVPPPPPPPPVEFSGWYLRGDIGFTNQQVDNVRFDFSPKPQPTAVDVISKEFETGGIFGIGIGYQFNNWLRADLTGEYRTATALHVFEVNTFGGFRFPEHNRMIKSEWVALANVYADLGTWWCVTPFVGFGLGMANVRLDGFTDFVIGSTNFNGEPFVNANNHAGANDEWNLAWAVHAGLAYKVTPGFTVELAYRYLHLGDGKTGSPITGYFGTYEGSHYELNDIYSHDLKFGVRWMLTPAPAYAPPPVLIRKG